MDKPPLPATIGRFRIEALLGSGGMGQVYKAFDPTLQRTVAVKTVRGDIDNPDHLTRLYREAQACARLQHPNIVTVHEAGEIDGVVYIAMEYLKGEDLAVTLARGQLSFEEKIRILVQVLDALEHAHEEDVIHRDIKPSNIQRLPDGSVKVVDFGLARMTRADTLTATGAIMGTPHYASPEQLRGQQIDKRTDIYSTGALAYEMCTGRRPFQGEGDSVATLILKVISEPLPPMNVSWSQRFPAIEHIVGRAMAKSADDRYQSAAEMRDALSAFLATSRDLIAGEELTAVIGGAAGGSKTARRSVAPDAPTALSSGGAPTAIAAVPSTRIAAPGAGARTTPAMDSASTTLGTSTTPAAAPRRTLWWLGGVAAALVVTAALTLPQFRAAAPTASGQAATPALPAPVSANGAAPSTSAPAMVPTSAPANRGSVAPAGSSPGGPGAAAPPDAQPAASDGGLPISDAGARELFYGGSTVLASGAVDTPAGTVKNAGLSFRMIQVLPNGNEKDVDPETSFRSGDKVRLSFVSNIDGFLYVVVQGSSGKWDVLFPSPQINGGKNAIHRFEPYVVPQNDWFAITPPAGTEHIFVFLSRAPLEQLPGFDRPVSQPQTLMASVVDELQKSVRSRDLKLEKNTSDRTAPGGKASEVTYVVNRDEVGKAVTASIQLVHGQ